MAQGEFVIIAARPQRMLPTGTAAERQHAREALQAEVAELERALEVLRFVDESEALNAAPARGVVS